MDDETLTPFVDALSASLIIMILIAISFILQNAIVIGSSAKNFVDFQVEEETYSPIEFRRPLRVDIEKKEILFIVNFELTEEEISAIREDMLQYPKVNLHIKSKQSERKSTANLIRFISMIDLPKQIVVSTKIEASTTTTSHLTWRE